MRTRGLLVTVVLSAVIAGLTGCSATGPVGATDVAAVHVVQVEQERAGATALVRVARVTGAPRSTVEWRVSGVDPSSATVAMDWVDGGSPKCGEVNRVEVAERSGSVTVGLVDTVSDPRLNCLAFGVARHFLLHLQSPLRGRALLEPATGANDGLPHFSVSALSASSSSASPPIPACSTDETVTDSPIGMPDAGLHMAPADATGAVVCRTAWPHGIAHATSARVHGTAEVRRLVHVLNRAGHPAPLSRPPASCPGRSTGDWYAVYLTGRGSQVEVFVNEIDCGTVTNGALQATTTPQIGQALATLFR